MVSLLVPPLEQVDHCGRTRSSEVVREAQRRAGGLPCPRLAAELPYDLHHLSDADRPERSSLRLEPARRVERHPAAGVEPAARELGAGLALLDEPEVLEADEGSDIISKIGLNPQEILRPEVLNRQVNYALTY